VSPQNRFLRQHDQSTASSLENRVALALSLYQTAPDQLDVEAAFAQECDGRYELVTGITYSHYPVWKQLKGNFHLFASPAGLLIFGEVESFEPDKVERSKGVIASLGAAGGAFPHEIEHWQRDNGDKCVVDDTISVCMVGDDESEETESEGSEESDDIDDDGENIADEIGPRVATMLTLPPPEDFMRVTRRVMTM